MKSNYILGPDTTMVDFRPYIRAHQHSEQYSIKFSEEIYATEAYRNGHETEQDHLEAVADALPDSRLAADVYYRLMNPALLLRMIEDAGAPQSTVKKAFDHGRTAFEEAIAKGLPVSGALGKACAAIRDVSWIYLQSTSGEDVVSWPRRSEAAIA